LRLALVQAYAQAPFAVADEVDGRALVVHLDVRCMVLAGPLPQIARLAGAA
jgi:hypothetical protein